MPWAALDTPSLALGLLHGLATAHGAQVKTVCANLDFFDWAVERLGIRADDYDFFASRAYFDGYGDWVFSSALYGDPQWRLAQFTDEMSAGLDPRLLDLSVALHEIAPLFIDELAERLAREAFDVVGFTTTFQQNTAALAAARQLKHLTPSVVTVFGGANCDGTQGEALHRNFPWLDHVVRGEGEAAFPALLAALRRGTAPRDVPGLCWTDADGNRHVNPLPTAPLPPELLPTPEFTPFFDRFQRSPAREQVEPKLVLEGSRGCWWGEKHHCTFCGLNGSTMAFRSKDPDVFLREINELAARHQVLDIIVVDNILDMGHLRTLVPQLAASGHDFRFHFEIKSNLRKRHLSALAAAGIVQVQPGIESLSTHVLQLMDKGVTGCQNVRHLRDAQSAGVSAAWNYLFGFPGESEADYDTVITQMAALEHLTPPGGVTRIAIERFSPYFDRPELGFSRLRSAAHYAHVYDLPEEELRDLAYLFDAPQAGIGDAAATRLEAAVGRWAGAHPASRLTCHDLGGTILLINQRRAHAWSTLTLHDPLEVAAFRLLEEPRTVQSVTSRLSARLGEPVAEEHIMDLLARWGELGIVFTDAGRYVHVVPSAMNTELWRLGGAPVEGPDGAPDPRTAADGLRAPEVAAAPGMTDVLS
jgi:ribosomal peptide maturation radical SAM protein 1